jgi:hypothetical protein
MRVTFVGRRVLDAPHVLSAPAGGIEPAFVEHRGDGLGDRVAATAPDAVVVLRPLDVDPATVRALGVPALAVLDEPLAAPFELDVWDPVRDLGEALADTPALAAPATAEALAAYDRVLATDPLVARALPAGRIWRSAPLPVDDALFLPHRADADPGVRPLFIGPSNPYRETWLVDSKHHYDLTHYAFGLHGERLRRVLETTTVGVVVRPALGVSAFPRAVGLHLAAGHLLVTEPLVPTRGLEPGLDHLTVHEPDQLIHVLHQLRRRPRAFALVRMRGRHRAEELRASRVWPRLLADLRADVAAFA